MIALSRLQKTFQLASATILVLGLAGLGHWYVHRILAWGIAGFLTCVLGIFLLNFFRDPERDCVQNDDLVLSPADGVVQAIEKIGPEILGEPGWMFTIFLNVFDVHVQRAPVTGTVKDVKRISGRYHPAYKKGIGTINHRVEIVVESPRGKARISQIAGLLARRIICRLGVGDQAVQGERYGMIVLGSCVQLAVGDKFSPRVEVGARVQGGLTVLAGLGGTHS